MAPVSSKMIPMDSLRAIISRLARMTSSLGGLDAVLMLAQYSSPFVIALVLKLARYRALYAKNRGYLDLVKTAEGLGKVGASLSEARLIMRLCGEYNSPIAFVSVFSSLYGNWTSHLTFIQRNESLTLSFRRPARHSRPDGITSRSRTSHPRPPLFPSPESP